MDSNFYCIKGKTTVKLYYKGCSISGIFFLMLKNHLPVSVYLRLKAYQQIIRIL